MRSAKGRALPTRPPPSSLRRTIIYVGAFELPDRNAAAQRALANALILKEIGYNVVLIGVSRDLDADSEVARASHCGVPFECWEIPHAASNLTRLRRLVSIRDVARVVEAHDANDLAAIICYSYPSIAQARLTGFFHRRGALALAEASEWYSAMRMRSPAAVLRNIDRPLRMRWANRRMDGIITASAFLSDFYGKWGIPTVQLPTLVPDEMGAGTAVPATPDGLPKRLFFAGSFDSAIIADMKEGLKDRLDNVIEALSIAVDLGAQFHFDIYGLERADYLAVVPSHEAILANLGDQILFHGRQPRDVVRACLARADYSIFLRKKTIVSLAGFPTKYAESVHFGTPVITNAVGSVVDYHVEGRTGHYIDYEDSSLAGRQLSKILGTSASEVNAMKEYCRSSGLFYYRNYTALVERFMAELKEKA